jgi:hypothetical protein
MSAAERAAAGKEARRRVPRSAHGDWEPAADRPDPVGVLEGQAAQRVAELIPLRYGRMLVSPFTFYDVGALLALEIAVPPADLECPNRRRGGEIEGAVGGPRR